jgi:hypothetical protein
MVAACPYREARRGAPGAELRLPRGALRIAPGAAARQPKGSRFAGRLYLVQAANACTDGRRAAFTQEPGTGLQVGM